MAPRHLELAGRAVGFMPDDEGRALYDAALFAGKTGLGPLVEIGTYRGKSALYLGAAASELGFLVFTIDHHRGSEENQPGWEHHDPAIVDRSTGQIDTLPFARRAVAEAGLEHAVVLVVGESTRVASVWSTSLSMLFIDGGHASEVEWADYRAWAPKVAPGGLLAVHDVFPDPADGGSPPYEIYCDAVESGLWQELPSLSCGSLRVLRRDDGEGIGPSLSASTARVGTTLT